MYRVIPGLRKLQIVDFIDQVDPLNRAVGLEFAGKDLPGLVHRQTHADRQDMVSGFAISQRYEPNHLRVSKGELAGFDFGENAKEGLFASDRVDVDAIAGEPGEELWFGAQKYRGKSVGGLVDGRRS